MTATHFNPKPGDFGEQHIALSRELPANPITASNTVRHYLPIVASEIALSSMSEMLYYKGGALVFGGTTPTLAGATTARMVKRLAAGTIVPLSATVTIASGQATGSVLAFPILNTATDNDRTIRPNSGDTLLVEITTAGAVSQQPTSVLASAKLAVLR